MRVVLDTNVLVRATKSASGPAREILRLLSSDRHLHHSDVLSHCQAHGVRVLTDLELLGLLRIVTATSEPGE